MYKTPNANKFNLKRRMIGVCTSKFDKIHNMDASMSHTNMDGIAMGPMTILNDNNLMLE